MIRNRSAGFTLIELMVTVAIIGILAAVAMPMYTDYITRGKIPEATNNLSTMRVRLEQYYQDNRTYISSGTTCGVAVPTSTNFSYTCSGTSDTYLVTATGLAARGMSGFSYTINEAGTPITTGVPAAAWGTVPVNCWIIRKGGGC
jgi:type IV pilus assembly protein PilE